MQEKAKILVVEDETAIREGLIDVLVFHGFDVEWATTGTEGLEKALTGNFDLLLLDVMLPGLDGFEICDRVRARDTETPIIMLTARSGDEDTIHGLRLGAVDYVAKPFSIQQLVLRIQAVLRRSRSAGSNVRDLQFGALVVNLDNLTGQGADGERQFTKREAEMLGYLASLGDRPASRDELLEEVWGYSGALNMETRTVDIHIAKLRRKIEANPSRPRHLVTVRGVGYRLITGD